MRKWAFCSVLLLAGPLWAQVNHDEIPNCETPFPPNDASAYDTIEEFQAAADQYFDQVNAYFACMSLAEIAVRRQWNQYITEEIRKLRESLEFERDTRLNEIQREREFTTDEVNRVIQMWVRTDGR